MTYPQHYTLPTEFLEQIATEGLGAVPEMIRVLLYAAMQAERHQYLGVGPYERSPERRDQANDYKSKTFTTRVGDINLDVPQVRSGKFYPQVLGKDLRSERALSLALAEMYVQGVPTRKVAAITKAVVRQSHLFQPG